MNQQCKVCGEPAAGFHFGAFTCEGCKSFFGRSYNNLSSISECKNNGGCVINKKNRTSCKACRLRKCLMVGMSKSGSRYGRRSNWFKIHCLLQEQQQQSQQHQQKQHKNSNSAWDAHPGVGVMNHPDPRIHQFLSQQHAMGRPTTKEDLLFMGLDEYKNSTSPSISSPESHNSDSSVEVSDARLRANFFRPPESKDMFLPFATLPVFPPPFSFPPMFPPNYLYKPTPMITTSNNNVEPVDVYSKRFFLDAVLQSQRSPNVKEEDEDTETEEEPPCDQENPMDLSMKNCLIQERTFLSEESDDMSDNDDVTVDNEEDDDSDGVRDEIPEVRSAPMDLSVSLKC